MIKLSIITVVYNSVSTIRSCIESVRDQSRPAEHIIIDGGSTDGTLDVIEEYQPILAKVVSEKDNGMYDALNKGIRLATGDVIGLLHADDFYADSNVLSNVSRVLASEDVDSCYGDLVCVDAVNTDKIVRYWHSGAYNYRRFYWGWMPPHPTFFVRKRNYYKYGGFRLDKGSAADYELMLRFLVKHKISAVYLPEVLIKMRRGGMSNASLVNRLKANYHDKMAWKVNGLNPYPWTLFLKPLSKIGQFFNR